MVVVIVICALGSTNNKTVSHKFQVTNKRRQLKFIWWASTIVYEDHQQCGTNQKEPSSPIDHNVSSQVLHCLSFLPTIPLSVSFPALCPTACFILSMAQFLRLPLSLSHHLALLFEILEVLCELDADIDHHVLSDQLSLARIVIHLIQDVQKGLVIGEPKEKWYEWDTMQEISMAFF